MFAMEVRGPARPEVWGAEVTSGCVKYVGGVTLLPSSSPQDVGPPRQTGAEHLGPLLYISSGKKRDGKEGNEPRSFRMNRIDNHCQQ